MPKDTATTPRVIRMTVEYDGTRFSGWQWQKDCRSVQHELEVALGKHLGHPVRVTAAGRTDQGVHAVGQVISFKTTHTMSPYAIERGVFNWLPSDLSVRDAREAAPNFDARRSARLRWYRYFLMSRLARPAPGRQFITHVAAKLDMDRMRAAADVLAGHHDFQAFRASSCKAKRTMLTMWPVQITPLENDIIQLDFRCRSFLQNQVRVMAGCIVNCGRKKMQPEEIEEMFQTGVRSPTAITLHPNGLYLYRVFYEDDEMPKEL